jgi:hypothetical protein
METDIGETLVETTNFQDIIRERCKSHIEYIQLQPKPQNFNAGKYVKRGLVPCRRGCGLFFRINKVNEDEKDPKKVKEDEKDPKKVKEDEKDPKKCNTNGIVTNDSRHGKVLDDDAYSEYIIHSQHCDVKYQLMEVSRFYRNPEHKTKIRDDVNGSKPESLVEIDQLIEKTKSMSISNRPNLSFDDYKEQIEKKKLITAKNEEYEWDISKIPFSVVNTRGESRKMLNKLPTERSGQRVEKWLKKYKDDMRKKVLETSNTDA